MRILAKAMLREMLMDGEEHQFNTLLLTDVVMDGL
jgi:hypothetical protein